jgi:hemoglobin-like flavoprotein
MTSKHKQLVQESWAQVAPIADTAAIFFYTRLFELDPDLQGLFARTTMHTQGNLLVRMLGTAVKILDNPERRLPAVEQLGQRYLRYGVEERHYDTVGAALLWTLGLGLGKTFTPEVREAWAETYALLSTTMKRVARQTLKTPALVSSSRGLV